MNYKFSNLSPSAQQSLIKIVGDVLIEVDADFMPDQDGTRVRKIAAIAWESVLSWLLDNPNGICFLQAMALSQRTQLKGAVHASGLPEVVIRPQPISLADPLTIDGYVMDRGLHKFNGVLVTHYYKLGEISNMTGDLKSYFYSFMRVLKATTRPQDERPKGGSTGKGKDRSSEGLK